MDSNSYRYTFTCCKCLYFDCYCRYQDLHSFPTRRSSDLVGRKLGKSKALMERWSKRHNWVARVEAHAKNFATLTRRVEGDRKSTRLNSSHRCISYAVFCLKKKKDDRPPITISDTRNECET